MFHVKHRGVAQFGSAAGLEPVGRRFKSCRPDHTMFHVKHLGSAVGEVNLQTMLG